MKKVVMITGVSSGIGKTCAEYLSRRGFTVYGTSRNPAAVQAPYPVIPLDVTDPDSVRHAVNSVIEREGRIDVLVNNAGFSTAGAMENYTEQEMQHDMQTFFFGTVRMMKTVLPHMRVVNRGTIINISSIAGLMGLPFQGFYSASKFAIQGICESLRLELRPYNIHIVTINPGDILSGVSAHRIIASAAFSPNPYQSQFKQSLARINEDESKGSEPQLVAMTIAKIIKSRRPSRQYIAGRIDQRLAVYLKAILPARLFAWILASHYKVTNEGV